MAARTLAYDGLASGFQAGLEDLSESDLANVNGGWLIAALVLVNLFEVGLLGGVLLHDATQKGTLGPAIHR